LDITVSESDGEEDKVFVLATFDNQNVAWKRIMHTNMAAWNFER
jgi:hypothetical protein